MAARRDEHLDRDRRNPLGPPLPIVGPILSPPRAEVTPLDVSREHVRLANGLQRNIKDGTPV
jgi:hypothetical protein